jgi:DNA mismatch endonuclease (patch repair protein)
MNQAMNDARAQARERAWARGTHPRPSTEGRSRNMQAIRRTDTKPEVELRKRLHAMGLRFRKDHRLDLPGGRVRPDIVFTRRKVAVFVDSCFWHCCPDHGHAPTKNEWYWGPKLARNVERDEAANHALEAAGWIVIRVWEHEGLDSVAARIQGTLD